MSKPRVFISFTRKDQEGPVYSSALYQLLNNHGFDAFRDADSIDAGEKWEDKLQEELRSCQGGVVVVSPGAAKSEWMPEEVTILKHYREALGEQFRLIPVVVGETKSRRDKSDTAARDLRIDEYQAVKPADTGDLQSVLEALDPLKRRFGDVALGTAALDAIIDQLEGAGIGALDAMKLGLRIDEPSSIGGTHLLRIVATALAEALLKLPLGEAFGHLNQFLSRRMTEKETLNLAESLAFHWVELKTGKKLKDAKEGDRIAGLSTTVPYAGKMSTARASGVLPGWGFVYLLNRGEKTANQLTADIYKAMADQGVARRPEARAKQANPLVVFIPYSIDAKVLEKLRCTFIHFTFIVGDPLLRDDDSVKVHYSKGLFLPPQMSDGEVTQQEKRFQEAYDDLTYDLAK